jgi:hypothetical protein
MPWVHLPTGCANSVCSLAPAEDCLPPACSGGAPSAPSRLTPTANACSRSASETGTSSHSPSGMTSVRSTGAPGPVQLTLFREGSPARTSPAQGAAPVYPETARVFGSRCSASLARHGLRTSLPRIAHGSALEAWTSSSRGLPAWGLMLHGECWELITSVRRTSVTACGSLLPTPTGAGNEGSPSMQKWPAHRALRAMLPTPLTRDHRHGGPVNCRSRQGGRALNEVAHQHGLTGGVFIALREWMMGWPLGWSASEPLATDRFREWLNSHGSR